MANEFVAQLSPATAYRETPVGYSPWSDSALTGDLRGLRLHKMDGDFYNWVFQIPANLTMATGLTFTVVLVDDGALPSDLGKVVRLAVSVKLLASAESTDLDAAGSAETAANITLQATTGQVTVATIAVTALDSAAVGNVVALRLRRVGSNAADTCQGSVILLGVFAKNT